MSDDALDRLIAAEQDERRRLALFLHDGPVQNLSGIALMLDAALHSIETGKLDDARNVLSSALERQRTTIRELRDLSFALEPVVLRDQGFAPAMQALAEQIGTVNQIRIDLEIEAAEQIGEAAQVATYTIIRELLEQAVRSGPPRTGTVPGRRNRRRTQCANFLPRCRWRTTGRVPGPFPNLTVGAAPAHREQRIRP